MLRPLASLQPMLGTGSASWCSMRGCERAFLSTAALCMLVCIKLPKDGLLLLAPSPATREQVLPQPQGLPACFAIQMGMVSVQHDWGEEGGGGQTHLLHYDALQCPMPVHWQVVQKLWAYIREHGLQNPKDKRKIVLVRASIGAGQALLCQPAAERSCCLHCLHGCTSRGGVFIGAAHLPSVAKRPAKKCHALPDWLM